MVSAVPGGVHEADDVAVTIAVEAQERSSADPTVIPFSERAPHIQWLFEVIADGLGGLTDELAGPEKEKAPIRRSGPALLLRSSSDKDVHARTSFMTGVRTGSSWRP